MTLKEDIIKAIEELAKKEIRKLSIGKDVPTVIMGTSGEKYKVIIDGAEHWIKDGVGLGLSVGTSVWVRIPEGNMSFAYICAKR